MYRADDKTPEPLIAPEQLLRQVRSAAVVLGNTELAQLVPHPEYDGLPAVELGGAVGMYQAEIEVPSPDPLAYDSVRFVQGWQLYHIESWGPSRDDPGGAEPEDDDMVQHTYDAIRRLFTNYVDNAVSEMLADMAMAEADAEIARSIKEHEADYERLMEERQEQGGSADDYDYEADDRAYDAARERRYR